MNNKNKPSYPDQKGRIFIVTGANAGLGFENTKDLAKLGAKVIMACRSIKRGKAALDEIKADLPNADLEVMELDLSSLASVKRFAADYKASYDRLDVLINNAGVMTPPYTKTEDGFELQFGANYLGHFLLTGLLLDTLLATPNSRIVTLSSAVHRNGKINFDDLQSERGYDAMEAYSQSKLACLMFMYELQRRLDRAGHTDTYSTGSHPGIAMTSLSRHMPKWQYTLLKYTFAPLMSQSASAGAQPTLLAALGDTKGGEYYGPTGFKEYKGAPGKAESTDLARNEAIAKRLWEVSEELVGYKYL